MGAVYKYLLKVTFLSGCEFPDDLAKTKDAIKSGLGQNNVVYKVVGENMIVSVVEDGIEEVLTAVNKVCSNIEVSSIPLRAYENYVKDILGLDEGGFETDLGKLVKDGQHIFWIDVGVGYKGKSTKELISLWREEAEFVLAGTKSGQLNIVPYKVVADNRVHAFLSLPNGDVLDNALFGLPLVQKIGDNISVRAKHVQIL